MALGSDAGRAETTGEKVVESGGVCGGERVLGCSVRTDTEQIVSEAGRSHDEVDPCWGSGSPPPMFSAYTELSFSMRQPGSLS